MSERVINKQQAWENSANAALALYSVLHNGHLIRTKRAKLTGKEVEALPIDFSADLEIRAKEVFNTRELFSMWGMVLEDPDSFVDLPQFMKQRLGESIEKHDLGVDGHYKKLYYRVKNAYDRKRTAKEQDGRRDDVEGFGVAYS